MGGVTQSSGRRAGATDQPTKEQAKEKAQEVSAQVQEKAGEMRGQAASRLRGEVDTRTTQAGTQLSTTADAMRRTGQKLREEGNSSEANIIDGIAERAERLGGYLTNIDADRLLRDVEDFGRRQPWLLAFGGAAIGFFASRFMKASSGQRYASSGEYEPYRSLPQGSQQYGALNPADLDAPSTREVSAEPSGTASASGTGKQSASRSPKPKRGGTSGKPQ